MLGHCQMQELQVGELRLELVYLPVIIRLQFPFHHQQRGLLKLLCPLAQSQLGRMRLGHNSHKLEH